MTLAIDRLLVARTTCRSCSAPLEPVLTLGPQHLPYYPRSAGTPPEHPAIPLELTRCVRAKCGLVQLAHTTPADWMFREYWYRSGVNETMVAELRDIVRVALELVSPLPPHALVADIGANDGTLLAQYRLLGAKVSRIAWEPARNLYDACRPHAEVLFPDYFRYEGLDAEHAWVISSIACFYDLDDPHSFVADVTRLLHPQGVWCIQQAYLGDMLTTNGFDNIGHEHLEYYALKPLEYLLAQHGLEVFAVEHRAINAGSFRTWIQHRGARQVQPSVPALRALEALEFAADPWPRFAQRVQEVRERLTSLLGGWEAAGVSVDLYGASTKASTLLQYCHIDARQIRQCWERSEPKWGRYVGSTGIPIVSEGVGRLVPPPVLLVGPWQFRTSFLEREREFLKAGGRMVFPLPEVETVALV